MFYSQIMGITSKIRKNKIKKIKKAVIIQILIVNISLFYIPIRPQAIKIKAIFHNLLQQNIY